MPAIDIEQTNADMINNGFRPDLSTTNNAKMLLNSWTNPTIIVAKWWFTELPAKKISVNEADHDSFLAFSNHFVPDAWKISTVKKIIASIPLICCSTSKDSPILNGINTGRVKKFNLVSVGFLISSILSAFSTRTANDAGDVGNFNQRDDFSASSCRHVLRNQTGESGMNSSRIPNNAVICERRDNVIVEEREKMKKRKYSPDMNEENQARVSHLTKLPIV